MNEHSIKMREYPVEYSEVLEYDDENNEFNVTSTNCSGGCDTETAFECDCGEKYYSMQEARRHMMELNE